VRALDRGGLHRRRRIAAAGGARGGGGNGDWGTGLGFEAGNEAGFDADKERAREGVKGGTARGDERHMVRKPRMDAGDDACGARRGKTEKGNGKGG